MKDLMNRLRSFSEKAAETSVIGAIIAFSQRHKIVARVTCLILAILFWVYVDNKRISEVRFRIPIQIDLARDFAVADIEKRYVVIAARGSGDDLRNVNQNNISVFVKIQNPAVGETTKYPVSVLANDMSDAITLVPEDKTLFAMIEKRKVRMVHVEPKIEGSLDSRFVLGNRRVTPEEVEVSGAESVVDKIRFLETEPISLSGHVETFSQGVKLNLNDIKFCDVYQKYFMVDLPVYNAKDIIQVIVNLALKGGADVSDFEPVQKSVKLFVKTEKDNEFLSPDDFAAWINLPDAAYRSKDPGQYFPIQTAFTKPKINHSVIAVVPDRVQLRMRKK